jgi:glutaredoxin
MANKDVTVRNVNSKIYDEFGAETQKRGLSTGEAITQALQLWLTRSTEIIGTGEAAFDEETYNIKDQPIVIELYESPTCPHCPGAKRGVIEAVRYYNPKFVGVNFIDVSKPEALAKAAEIGIVSVPTTTIKIKIVGAHPLLREKITGAIKLLES